MSREEEQTTLNELIEETARQIIWTLQPGATSNPLGAVKQLLETFLEIVREQEYQDALRQHFHEEVDQQN